MEETAKTDNMLSPYRVLDLTDEKGFLCGKILGDTGADVIKIEKPGGDHSRSIGPFYHDEIDPQKSLYWFAFNTSKRGITLDIETAEGQKIFKELLKTADFVIESFAPGYLDKLGLGYSALTKVNPKIILVSITPFGQTGPYKNFKGPDIVVWAMGVEMYQWGDADRPPLRINYPFHCYHHAASEGAVGAMVALYHREMTGEGQHVDVSIQECIAEGLESYGPYWDTMKTIQCYRLFGHRRVHVTWLWHCKDGYVMWLYWGGPFGTRVSAPLVEWMKSEGMADDFLIAFDWTKLDFETVSQEVMNRVEEPTNKFFMSHTKAELLEGALKRRIMLYPVYDSSDILKSEQLAVRNFWVELDHPELGTTITYPGPFAKATRTPPVVSRRAPLIGEHNREIYEKELGILPKKLKTLEKAKII